MILPPVFYNEKNVFRPNADAASPKVPPGRTPLNPLVSATGNLCPLRGYVYGIFNTMSWQMQVYRININSNISLKIIGGA